MRPVIDLFLGKYRVPSARLRGWDYADAGMYFVTICTKNRVPWFGNVEHGVMQLSDVGKIVVDEWIRMGRRNRDVMLDEWIVMPDHVHGIIHIHPTNCVETPHQHSIVKSHKPSSHHTSPQRGVSYIKQQTCTCPDVDHGGSRRPADVAGDASDPLQKNTRSIGGASLRPRDVSRATAHHGQWQSGCLGAIINQFKMRCTKRFRGKGHHAFEWQPRFHDHVIRNDRALKRIRKYIRENPAKWDGSWDAPLFRCVGGKVGAWK